jgi:uncharacterized protein YggE
MSEQTITTTATGRYKAHPDVATVETKATGTGETAASARRVAQDCCAMVQQSLLNSGIESDNIRAVEFSVKRRADMFENDRTDNSYQAVKRLVIDCSPEAVDKIVSRTLDSGSTVPTVQFHLHDERQQQLQQDALAEAMNNARMKAEQLAAAEDLKIRSVAEITTLEDGTGMESIVEEALGKPTAGEFSPNPISMTEEVKVVYTATER